MTIVNSSNVSKELKRLNITEGDLSLLFNASENAVLSFLDKDTDRTRILGIEKLNSHYFDNSIFGRNIKRMIEKEKVLNKSLIK